MSKDFNHVAECGKLLLAGTSGNSIDAEGTPALAWACWSYLPEVVDLLLAHRADPLARNRSGGQTALHWAAMAGCVRSADVLLRHEPALLQLVDAQGMSPLQLAVHCDQLAMSEYLIVQGADPYLPNQAGRTCLHTAVDRDHLAICRLLLSHGMSMAVTTADAAGLTPIHLAVQAGHASLIKSLLLPLGAKALPLLEIRSDPGDVNGGGKGGGRSAGMTPVELARHRLALLSSNGSNRGSARERAAEERSLNRIVRLFAHIQSRMYRLQCWLSFDRHNRDVGGRWISYWVVLWTSVWIINHIAVIAPESNLVAAGFMNLLVWLCAGSSLYFWHACHTQDPGYLRVFPSEKPAVRSITHHRSALASHGH